MANNPCNIIRYDSEIGRLYDPTILLKTRSGKTLGNIIYDKESWSIKLSATDLDEISFDVYKYVDDKKNPVWDDLIDLRLIDVKGYGQFEISVDYSDKEQTIKTITAKSLETELGQLYLDEFHVNDDDATTMIMTDYNKDDFDADGNFIPTVFYNKDDSKHSLLDRVLADKAPHWSIGHVPEYIAVDKENEPELSSKFQRIFTVDGTTIYDFLTGDIAKECNVIFTFDTYNRIINCYNLEDYTWVSEDGKRTITINAIGNDTGIFIDKRKLAKEITITSKSDEVKNALKVKAGDDVISDYVRAANLNGSNMIYNFAKFQLDDMPKGLVNCLEKYQEMMDADANDYYGKNGIFTRLAKLYDDLLYYQSDMMPDVHLNETTAKEQYDSVKTYLQSNSVAVYDIETYSSTSFQGITNNVDAMANVGIDSRYKFEIIKDSVSYDSNTHKWKGRYTITRRTDDTDTYSSPDNEFTIVTINDDNLSYTKQKIEKALSKTDMSTVDFDVSNYTTDKQLYDYFNLYSQNRLKGFVEGYDSCISILASAVSTAKVTTNIVELQKKYKQRYDQCNKVYEERKKQVEDIQSRIVTLQDEQSKFASEHNLKNWLDKTDSDYYRIFCMYIREDTYENSNYISDGLTDSECINKAKELLNTAQAELKKSCVLQRTISTSINNLLCMSEFEKLREDFCLFNYIRVGTDDEVFKLCLIDVSFNASDPSGIDVTYSENIESVDGKTSDIKSILDQASSIASTYTYTSLQAKSGATANSVVTDMRNNGINAALMRLSNSDDNEVTYGREGIICKQVTDDGFYSDKATRITGSGMYITNDNWNTIKACVGETTDGNYGVIADTIVGKLIAGDQLVISNGNGSVKITGDGILLDGGSISWITPMDKSGVDGLEDDLANLKENIDQNAQNFTEAIKKAQEDLQSQIDGEITSWFEDYDPTVDNEPTSTWKTDSDKVKHEGDLFYNTATGRALRYIYNSSTKNHEWSIITDEAISKALADAATAQDTADRKRRVFVDTPYVPYDVGDLWAQGDKGDLYKCKIAKTDKQTYSPNDWEKATKYTDDTAWKNWTSDTGDFGKYKKDIQSQLDGKSETTYGGAAPPHNPEKGDLWFCTDGTIGYGKDKAYMYDGTTWQESNGVPDSVWDIADGKSSIFVTKPTKVLSTVDSNFYHKNDLWILESDTVLSGHTKGTVMVATSDSTKFNSTHWVEKVKYTDDTKANAVDKKLTAYKKEISDFQTQVDTQFSVAGVTKQGGNYIYSPKIGAGYLYISKDGCSVTINPANEDIAKDIIVGGDTDIDADTSSINDYVFSVTVKNENRSKNVFSINRNGSAYFNGEIKASSGAIGGWDISNGGIKHGDDTNFLKLDSTNKALISSNGNSKVVVTNGNIKMCKGSTEVMSIYGTNWSGKTNMGLNFTASEQTGFIAFGRVINSGTYNPDFYINYDDSSKQRLCFDGTAEFGNTVNFNNSTSFNYNTTFNHNTTFNYAPTFSGGLQGGTVFNRQNLTGEGGELILQNAYSNTHSAYLDVLSDSFRVHNGSAALLSVDLSSGITTGNFSGSFSGNATSATNATYASYVANTASSSHTANMYSTSDNKMYYCPNGSSKRFKTDIEPVKDDKLDPHKLYDIDVVQFKYKPSFYNLPDDTEMDTVIGIIAEDVEEKYPCAAEHDEDNGEVINWLERYLVPPMLSLIQEQHKEIEILKTEINELKEKIK